MEVGWAASWSLQAYAPAHREMLRPERRSISAIHVSHVRLLIMFVWELWPGAMHYHDHIHIDCFSHSRSLSNCRRPRKPEHSRRVAGETELSSALEHKHPGELWSDASRILPPCPSPPTHRFPRPQGWTLSPRYLQSLPLTIRSALYYSEHALV